MRLEGGRTARGESFPCLFSESLELARGRIGLASRGFHEASGRGFVELGAANCER